MRGVSTTVASAGGQFSDAVGYVLQAMLQSPRFVYRIERQPDHGSVPVNDYELASRISYILWGSSPDAALMDSASKSQLEGKRLARHIDRMLADPRAAGQASSFISQWLNLDRLKNLRPDKNRFNLVTDMTIHYVKTEPFAFLAVRNPSNTKPLPK